MWMISTNKFACNRKLKKSRKLKERLKKWQIQELVWLARAFANWHQHRAFSISGIQLEKIFWEFINMMIGKVFNDYLT